MHFHARSLLGTPRIVKRWGLLVVSVFEPARKGLLARSGNRTNGFYRATFGPDNQNHVRLYAIEMVG